MDTGNIGTVIQRAKEKDPKALDAIYNMYRLRMTAICKKIVEGDEDTARDLTHDAFILAFASLDKLKDNEKLGEWLATITKNVALKYMVQKRKIPVEPLSAMQTDEPAATDVSLQADASVNNRDILSLVSQLPEGYAKVFRLSVIEGFTHKEIADMLSIAPHSSSSQLARAKKMLRRMMGREALLLVTLLLAVVTGVLLLPDTEEKQEIGEAQTKTEKGGKSFKVIRPPHEEEGNAVARADKPAEATADTSVALPVYSASTETTAEAADKHTEADKDDTKSAPPKPASVNPSLPRHGELLAGNKSTAGNSLKWQLSVAGSLGIAQQMQSRTSAPSGPGDDGMGTTSPGKVAEKVRHSIPMTFGLSLSRPLKGRWGIETGLQYTRLTSRFTTDKEVYTLVKHQKLHYVGVPLRVSFRMMDHKRLSAYASAGVALHIPLNATMREECVAGGYTISTVDQHIYPQLQWATSMSLGLQYRFVPHVMLFVEPSLNWYVPSGSDTRNAWTAHPLQFTSPLGLRIVW